MDHCIYSNVLVSHRLCPAEFACVVRMRRYEREEKREERTVSEREKKRKK